MSWRISSPYLSFNFSPSINLYLIILKRMDPQYSTLEHIRHDETAGALQRDHDTVAFEIDTYASAPQANKLYYKA